MSLSFLHRPIVFQEPLRAVHPPSWLDYTPFAFWITDALRPDTFVELGCQSGNSYSSFAQAIQTLGLSTVCYAVDTWRGDPQAGFFDDTVFDEWEAYHQRFSAFSRLIRATFDEALERFSNGSIDLLHLDGCHTFEAVSHDFESWRPKMSRRGVVLCHDIEVREKDFGAWRLWERLRDEYPSFEFHHGHGLGVLGIGHEFPEAVEWLFSVRASGSQEANHVRLFFSRLGHSVLSRYTAGESERALRTALAAQRERLDAAAADLEQARAELGESREAIVLAQTAIATVSDERANVEAALAGRTAEAERLTSEVAALHVRLTSLESAQAALVIAEGALAARTTEVEQLEANVRTLCERIDAMSCGLESRSRQLANREDELARLRADLANSEERLVTATADVQRLSDTLRIMNETRHDPRAPDTPRIALSVSSRTPREPHPATVIVVSHVGPWRPRAGNAYRVRRMLEWYRSKGYRTVIVVAPLPGGEMSGQEIEATASRFGNVIQIHRDGRIEGDLRDVPTVLDMIHGTVIGPYAELLGEQAGTTPREGELLRIERTFCHDAVIATVIHLHRSLGPHVLQVEYIWMTRLLPLVRGDVLKVVDTIDVFSSIDQKVRPFGLRDVSIAPDQEAERLSRADLVLAIQNDERTALRQLVPSIPVLTVGVDFDVVADRQGPKDGQLLMVASNNARNCKGVKDFFRLAWPRIHRRLPHAEIVVVGTVATAVADIELPGVTILGPVDDLATRYRDAALVINPVVAGTGLKIKTLEALCHLRPVVTWPVGVEGLDPQLAALCWIANDWDEFAEQVIAALEAPSTAIAEHRGLIGRLLGARHVYAELESAYQAFFSGPHSRTTDPITLANGAAGKVMATHAST
jgi:hypothetical protein